MSARSARSADGRLSSRIVRSCWIADYGEGMKVEEVQKLVQGRRYGEEVTRSRQIPAGRRPLADKPKENVSYFPNLTLQITTRYTNVDTH